ncbi:MAG: Transaldolase, partial [Planctomycetota bacterium]
MAMNRIHKARKLGQSLWYDSISRSLIDSGELRRLVEVDGIRGVTSNPSIFEKALKEGADYGAAVAALRAARPGITAYELYEELAVEDIRDACDALLPLHVSTDGEDGYVSLEVSLVDGDSTAAMVKEGLHLAARVGRANLMIKIPGTTAGVEAAGRLMEAGVSVNITLLFARERHMEVLERHLQALEARARKGEPLGTVASVASFFVSRIDTAIDKELAAMLAATDSKREKASIEALLGKAAIANAKLAYDHWRKTTASARWKALAKRGARPQRLLWASTGTKNPSYPDTLYVDALIGPATVNTAPPQTIAAFLDHGKPAATLVEDVAGARRVLAKLDALGVDLDATTTKLLREGLKAFGEATTNLLAALEPGKSGAAPAAAAKPKAPSWFSASLELQGACESALARMDAQRLVERVWERDASLWTGADEAKWLKWLDAPAQASRLVGELKRFADAIAKEGVSDVLLLGMGGSSLGPEVLARTFGAKRGRPRLVVLDSTDPSQVARIEQSLDFKKTLVVVASKSGSTLEPAILQARFSAALVRALGAKKAPSRLVAITDPGSKLEAQAKGEGWRAIFHGEPQIGGRFSVLSAFGLVPAALIGVDLEQFVARAQAMAKQCAEPASRNPGARLGALMGEAAKRGRDKLT